jgi:predicted nucleic acid-binding protein
MKRKVYIETSIISYLTARPSKTIIGAAHQQITQAWWDTRNDYDLFVSGSVLAECAAGNTDAAEKRLNAVNGVPLLSSTDSAIDLARHLILKSIIPRKAAEDALHIALATIHGMDYLLTWNCRHIANMEIQRNISHHLESIGLLLPIMCTPEELLGENDDDTTG